MIKLILILKLAGFAFFGFKLVFDNKENIFIEFKSCKGTDTESTDETKPVDIPKGTQFVNQFLAYLSDSRLPNLNGLLYVFNKTKTTTIGSAKEIMRKVFQLNAKKIYEARPAFFNSIEITPGINIVKYEDLESFSKNQSLISNFYSNVLFFVTIN